MKKLITTIAMLLLFVVGCTDQTTITSPVQSVHNQQHSLFKVTNSQQTSIYSPGQLYPRQNPNWLISLKFKGIDHNPIHSASKLIDGSKGGEVNLKDEVAGGPFGKIKVDSKLKINKQSFIGTMIISTEIDDGNFLTTFSPHYNFDIPLEYTLELRGVDLTGVDPDSVDFVYQTEDGSVYQCEYSKIEVRLNEGKVKVENAKLPHFSRYGFIR